MVYIIFPTVVVGLFSDPAGIRTRDPQLRRLLLYPAELPNHPCDCKALSDSAAIRTQDPRLRRALLYPAELRNHP